LLELKRAFNKLKDKQSYDRAGKLLKEIGFENIPKDEIDKILIKYYGKEEDAGK